jgi:hypothetical protein
MLAVLLYGIKVKKLLSKYVLGALREGYKNMESS